MTQRAVYIFLGMLLTLAGAAGDLPGSHVTFVGMDVFVDSRDKPLACYQISIVATNHAALVGIEGGETAAYSSAPNYDPRALKGDRIIIGAYSVANELPSGKIRVARLMFEVTGDAKPEYQAILQVAAAGDGQPITATVSVADAVRSTMEK